LIATSFAATVFLTFVKFFVFKLQQGSGLTSVARLITIQPSASSPSDCTLGASDALSLITISKESNPEIELPIKKLKPGLTCQLDEKGDSDESSAEHPHRFYYQWSADATVAGVEEVQHVCKPTVVQYLDSAVEIPSFAASDALSAEFGVLLSNGGSDHRWNQETAHRLLDVLRMIPRSRAKEVDPYEGRQVALQKMQSKWVLTEQHLTDGRLFFVVY
jgi:hypothetical protein